MSHALQLKLGLIFAGALALACSSSGGGGGSIAECEALRGCCEALDDATQNKQCHDQANQLAAGPNAAQSCASTLQSYTQSGACYGAGGTGGGGGSGTACGDLEACCANGRSPLCTVGWSTWRTKAAMRNGDSTCSPTSSEPLVSLPHLVIPKNTRSRHAPRPTPP